MSMPKARMMMTLSWVEHKWLSLPHCLCELALVELAKLLGWGVAVFIATGVLGACLIKPSLVPARIDLSFVALASSTSRTLGRYLGTHTRVRSWIGSIPLMPICYPPLLLSKCVQLY